MEEKRERKCNPITARISEADFEILEDLIDYTNKNKSDTITRAVKFWKNVADTSMISTDDSEKWGKTCKNVRVNLRVTDSDMQLIEECGAETGLSVSQIVRKAIREYHNSLHI